MLNAKNPSIDWPIKDTVGVIVGFVDQKEDTEYFNKAGYITIQLVPNQREHSKDGAEK